MKNTGPTTMTEEEWIARRAALVCVMSRFYHRLVNVAFCRRSIPNRALDAYPKSAIFSLPSRPHYRGAYRDRHGRWVRDAVDAAASSTQSEIAGQILSNL